MGSAHLGFRSLCSSGQTATHQADDETKDDNETEGAGKHHDPDSSESLVLGIQNSIVDETSGCDSLVAWLGVLGKNGDWNHDTIGEESTTTTSVESFTEIEQFTWFF